MPGSSTSWMKRVRACSTIATATTVIATLTLSQQTHILGAAGRAALLDAHQATQKMRNHTWLG
jgi:hypothetical protein